MRALPLVALLALSPIAGVHAATACCGDEAPAATFADITLADLKPLVAAKSVVLLDVNGSASFAKKTIPGAIDFQASANDLAKVLPADKNALIVAFCGGPKCSAWKKGAEAAAKLGYTNIRHFSAGIIGWQ